MPRPPCTWIARSITSCSTRAAKNLISETSTRASSPSSSRCAAWSVISRHAWMSAADSAIQFWTVCFSASGSPNALRSSEYEHISSNARCIWPSHRMTWWIRPGPRRFCAMRKPSPGSPSTFETRHAHVGEPRLAVRAPAAALVAHHRHAAHELVAGRVGRHEDHRRPLVRRRIGIGDDHDDAEARTVGARREPLVRVDHPVVAVAHRAPLQERRVGARDLGLRHAEERPRLACDERLEEPLLLVGRAEQVQDLAVAGIRRLAAEDQLRDEAAPDLLVQVRVLEEAAAGAARLRRQVRRPQVRALRLLLQLADERVGRLVLAKERRLVRIDVLLHEGAHLLAPFGDEVRDDNGRHLQP